MTETGWATVVGRLVNVNQFADKGFGIRVIHNPGAGFLLAGGHDRRDDGRDSPGAFEHAD